MAVLLALLVVALLFGLGFAVKVLWFVALVALALWIYVFVSAPIGGMIFAGGVVAAGVAAYFLFNLRR